MSHWLYLFSGYPEGLSSVITGSYVCISGYFSIPEFYVYAFPNLSRGDPFLIRFSKRNSFKQRNQNLYVLTKFKKI